MDIIKTNSNSRFNNNNNNNNDKSNSNKNKSNNPHANKANLNNLKKPTSNLPNDLKNFNDKPDYVSSIFKRREFNRNSSIKFISSNQSNTNKNSFKKTNDVSNLNNLTHNYSNPSGKSSLLPSKLINDFKFVSYDDTNNSYSKNNHTNNSNNKNENYSLNSKSNSNPKQNQNQIPINSNTDTIILNVQNNTFKNISNINSFNSNNQNNNPFTSNPVTNGLNLNIIFKKMLSMKRHLDVYSSVFGNSQEELNTEKIKKCMLETNTLINDLLKHVNLLLDEVKKYSYYFSLVFAKTDKLKDSLNEIFPHLETIVNQINLALQNGDENLINGLGITLGHAISINELLRVCKFELNDVNKVKNYAQNNIVSDDILKIFTVFLNLGKNPNFINSMITLFKDIKNMSDNNTDNTSINIGNTDKENNKENKINEFTDHLSYIFYSHKYSKLIS